MTRRFVLTAVLMILTTFATAATTLNGAGATFPYPLYSKWFSDYHKLHPDVEINYQSIGSGGGIRQLQQGTVDFGASDMPLADAQLKEMGKPIVQLPTVLGAVVPAYNVSGVSREIKFTPQALAGSSLCITEDAVYIYSENALEFIPLGVMFQQVAPGLRKSARLPE